MLILAAAVAAPLLSEVASGWIRVPSVVLEIALGILIGPVLGWVNAEPSRLPVALFLVVRGGPAYVVHRDLPRPDRLAIVCYLSTELPLVVVITRIGVVTGRLPSGKAAAMITAAMLSALVFPLVAGRLRERPTAHA